MISPSDIIKARNAGALRYTVLSDWSEDMNRALAKLGLFADSSLLIEYSRPEAVDILATLLHHDMAYDQGSMSWAEARTMSEQIVKDNETAGSRYFSNGNRAKNEGWNPLTHSTFDAGLIISSRQATYFCIWFEDED